MELDRNGLRILGRHECLTLLGSARLGRIALSQKALPTILPVIYRIEDDGISFHISGGLLAAATSQHHVVCFEVDSHDQDESNLWSVVVVGTLQPGTDASSGNGELYSFGSNRALLPITLMSGRSSMMCHSALPS